MNESHPFNPISQANTSIYFHIKVEINDKINQCVNYGSLTSIHLLSNWQHPPHPLTHLPSIHQDSAFDLHYAIDLNLHRFFSWHHVEELHQVSPLRHFKEHPSHPRCHVCTCNWLWFELNFEIFYLSQSSWHAILILAFNRTPTHAQIHTTNIPIDWKVLCKLQPKHCQTTVIQTHAFTHAKANMPMCLSTYTLLHIAWHFKMNLPGHK